MVQAQDKCFAYRQSRKAFIAACEQAGADVVGRVHPSRGPDGKPLFLDAAAFGPRLATSGVMVVAAGASGAGVLLALLSNDPPTPLPDGVRLVLVHGADPAGFAWNDPANTLGHSDRAWGTAMLQAIVTEDLRNANRLTLVRLGRTAPQLENSSGLLVHTIDQEPGGKAKKTVEAAIASAG
jgi:hypothetical protein